MIKTYFASNAPNRFGVKLLINHLVSANQFKHIGGIYVSSSWHSGGDRLAGVGTFKQCVSQDIDEVLDSDLLIAMYPFGNGARAEMNIALGMDIPMIALIPPEFIISDDARTGWSDNFSLAKFERWNFDLPPIYKHLIVDRYESIEHAIIHLYETFIKDTDKWEAPAVFNRGHTMVLRNNI